MPAWTLSTLVSRATQALGNRGDIALSDASFWANVAQEQVWNAIPHDAKEGLATSSTTSGGDKVALPSDFFELIQLSNLSLTPYLPMNPIQGEEGWSIRGRVSWLIFQFCEIQGSSGLRNISSSIKKWITSVARAVDSSQFDFQFDARIGTLSVCPSTLT